MSKSNVICLADHLTCDTMQLSLPDGWGIYDTFEHANVILTDGQNLINCKFCKQQIHERIGKVREIYSEHLKSVCHINNLPDEIAEEIRQYRVIINVCADCVLDQQSLPAGATKFCETPKSDNILFSGKWKRERSSQSDAKILPFRPRIRK